MKIPNSKHHEFAIYLKNLSEQKLKPNTIARISNTDLFHRITRVLRLKKDEFFILFDRSVNCSVVLLAASQKDTIKVEVVECNQNTILSPNIKFLLPILKRDAFEQAIYSLVEFGANTIQLITTQKTQRKWGGQKEVERLEKVMIAAAEQSKNYALPNLCVPKALDQIVQNLEKQATKIFFDPIGSDTFFVLENMRKSLPEHMILLVGPEGDLTNDEKSILKENNVKFCRLTPTILRAQQAVVVSLGIIRSLI